MVTSKLHTRDRFKDWFILVVTQIDATRHGVYPHVPEPRIGRITFAFTRGRY